MAATSNLWPLITYEVRSAGTPTLVAVGPMQGGLIVNPANSLDQNVYPAKTLYVNVISAAQTKGRGTTFPLPPGSMFRIPSDAIQVSVTSTSPGHRFSGIVIQPIPEFTPSTATFPPAAPTVFTGLIPAYLYEQYADDDDLQTMFAAYNSFAQAYINWFVNVGLPVYTGPGVSGALLDWVAAGLYGIYRPLLPSGHSVQRGQYNTFRFNTLQFNQIKTIGPTNYQSTSDDIFRRIITWHVYKGDGKVFNIRWLKRRVMRFLTGINGTAGETDETYPVSVTFGPDREIDINLQSTRRIFSGGAMYNVPRFNTVRFNSVESYVINLPSNPLSPIFKAAMDAGVLEMPFQFKVVVNVR